MLEASKAFSGIAVRDIDRSRHFFGEVLGLQVDDGEMGMLVLRLAGGRPVLLYPKATTSRPRTPCSTSPSTTSQQSCRP